MHAQLAHVLQKMGSLKSKFKKKGESTIATPVKTTPAPRATHYTEPEWKVAVFGLSSVTFIISLVP